MQRGGLERAGAAAAVGPQRGQAIGPGRQTADGAFAGEHRPEECRDRLATAEPGRERRHLQQRVVAQHLLEGFDIQRFERADVSVEQFALFGAGRFGQGVVGRDRGQLGARSLQCTVDRGAAGVQEFGHFVRPQRQHVAQNEHSALERWKMLQRSDERESHAFAGGHDRGRIAVVEQRIRERLEPRQFRLPGEQADVGDRTRLRQVHGQRPARSTFQRGQADVGRDPIEPGAHRSPLRVIGFGRAPGPQRDLLHQVFGIVQRAGHAIAGSEPVMR